MTKGKSAAPRPNLIESLGRISEVLPRDKLQSLQKLSEQEALTEEILLKEIGDRGILLVAFGAAASNAPTILKTAPTDIVSRVEELTAYVNSFAPALFDHPRIKATAQRFVETAQPSDDQLDWSPPFDDIDGIRGATTYLDLDGEFTPTVRLEVSFANRPALPVLSLRLVDVALLASSLLGTLAAALESSGRLAPHGLLDESEFEGPRRISRISQMGLRGLVRTYRPRSLGEARRRHRTPAIRPTGDRPPAAIWPCRAGVPATSDLSPNCKHHAPSSIVSSTPRHRRYYLVTLRDGRRVPRTH